MNAGIMDWDKKLYTNRKGRRKNKQGTYKTRLRKKLKPIIKKEESKWNLS